MTDRNKMDEPMIDGYPLWSGMPPPEPRHRSRCCCDWREDMTHTAPMADSQGEFSEFKTQPEVPCRKCGVHAVSMREWESSCGGWEDYQYKCHHCGHSWWVDGIDA